MQVFTASLVDMKDDIRAGPSTLFLETMDRKLQHGVLGEVDVIGVMADGSRTAEGKERYVRNNHKTRTVYTIQMGREGVDREEVNNILDTHYREGFNASQVEILNTVSWSYFPRWSPAEAAQGRHWQVFDIQGSNNMWYGGSSVSFESVKSVLEYNNLLLRQMDKGWE